MRARGGAVGRGSTVMCALQIEVLFSGLAPNPTKNKYSLVCRLPTANWMTQCAFNFHDNS